MMSSNISNQGSDVDGIVDPNVSVLNSQVPPHVPQQQQLAFTLADFKKSLVDKILAGLRVETPHVDKENSEVNSEEGSVQSVTPVLSVAASNSAISAIIRSPATSSKPGKKRTSDTMSDLFPQQLKKPHIEVDDSENPTNNINMASDILEDVIADMPDVEETGKPIHEALAKRVLKQYFTNSQKSEIRTELCKTYKLPENCSQLRVPKLNQGIRDLRSFSDTLKKQEKRLYLSQQFISKAATVVTMIADKTLKADNEMVDPKEVVRCCLDTITFLGYASHELNMQRKMNIKPALHYDVRDICSSFDVIQSEHLFGEDLTKLVKDARQNAKIASFSTSTSYKSRGGGHKSSYVDRKSYHPKSFNPKASFLSKGKQPTQHHGSNRKKI